VNQERKTASPEGEGAEAGEQSKAARVMSPDEAYEAARKAEKQKRPDVAEKLYRKILAADPMHGKSAHALALIMLKSGRVEAAMEMLKKAAALQPKKALIHHHLATVFEKQKLPYEAEMAVRHAISLDAETWRLHQQLGEILFKQERFKEAIPALVRALELSPDNYSLLNQIGAAHHKSGDYALAEEYYQKALAVRHDDFKSLHNLGTALLDQDRAEEAESILSRALSRRPDDPYALTRYGRALMAVDRQEEARALFDQCLEINPGSVDALYSLSFLHAFRPDDPLLRELQDAEKQYQDQPKRRAMILNALGRAMHSLGKHDAAFAYYASCNDIRDVETYKVRAFRESAKDIARVFDPDLLKKAGPASASGRIPIFIFGTPRSGKSLVEKLLKRHPDVTGLGENKAFSKALSEVLEQAGIDPDYPEFVTRLDASIIESVGQRYLELTDGIGPEARYVTNTIPGNARFGGLIAMALPQARLISIERDLKDVCLQMYFKYFAHGNNYAVDLEHLGSFYAQHRFIMAHWYELLGDRILQLSYESLVTDTEPAWRQLESHCGLSSRQLTPLEFSKDYIGIAENYVQQLEPLLRSFREEEQLLRA
jgi:tetratricopeptide (TPR) repeat protein